MKEDQGRLGPKFARKRFSRNPQRRLPFRPGSRVPAGSPSGNGWGSMSADSHRFQAWRGADYFKAQGFPEENSRFAGYPMTSSPVMAASP